MRLAVAVLAVFSFAACMSALTPHDELSMILHEYNEGVRWNRLEQSVIHVPPSERRRFVDRHAGLEDELEILDVEILRMDVDRGKKTADAQVNVSWSLKSRGIVEHTVVDQAWRQREGQWLMEKETRLKGARLSLFDEAERPTPPSAEAGLAAPAAAAAQ